MRWLENGTKWLCQFCGNINKTKDNYYSQVGPDGYRLDHEQRPELSIGTVDFLTPKSTNPHSKQTTPAYLFAFDVSKCAIESGYLQLACTTLLNVIENRLLPGM